MVLLGLKASPSLPFIHIVSHYIQTFQCLFHVTRVFPSRGFFLCPCDQQQTSVQLEGAKTHLTVDTDTCPAAASNSLQICFLMVYSWLLTLLTSFSLSSRWWFMFSSWSWWWQDCAINFILKQLFGQLIFRSITALKWLQVTFLTFSNE